MGTGASSKYKELEGKHYGTMVEPVPSQKGKLIAITGCTRFVLLNCCGVLSSSIYVALRLRMLDVFTK